MPCEPPQVHLDIANGSRGEITKIVLDERETDFSPTAAIVELTYPPAYVLIKLNRTKAVQLEGLEKNIIPLVPMERTFTVIHGNHPKSIRRRQLPLTPAYSFTDAGLTPFNVYVALSRARGRDGVRLLRDFDENLLMTHPSEHLRIEDERLAMMDRETEQWWKEKTTREVVLEDIEML